MGGGGDLQMMVLLENECSLSSVVDHIWWDTQTLLAVFKKKIKLFALSGSRKAKTLAMSPHALAQAFALALTPNKLPGGISTT